MNFSGFAEILTVMTHLSKIDRLMRRFQVVDHHFRGEASRRRSTGPSSTIFVAWNMAQQWRRARVVEGFKSLNSGFLVLGTFGAGEKM